ncbi:unnamed protein product [Brachionus calyciflorus]|uniref:ISXO2-like transposase domain-containing protein n=1 Tax=Brachionus calyciflorus TaxID=104777 RepID=A0A814D013_9BILA|nr:unnamed protein product [Brachionus calyciflorus]
MIINRKIFLICFFYIGKIFGSCDKNSCKIQPDSNRLICRSQYEIISLDKKCFDTSTGGFYIKLKQNEILSQDSLTFMVKFFVSNYIIISHFKGLHTDFFQNLNRFEISSDSRIFITLKNAIFELYNNQNLMVESCQYDFPLKENFLINHLTFSFGMAYRTKICPQIFQNLQIENFFFEFMANIFYKKNFISFTNIYQNLNIVIKRVYFNLCDNLNLDKTLLSSDIFNLIEELHMDSKIKSIESDLFKNFTNLRYIEFNIFFTKYLFHKSLEWIKSINQDLNVNISNRNDINSNSYRTAHIKLVQNGLIRDDYYSKNYFFSDENFCLYKDFPFNQMVFLSFDGTFSKNEETCTEVFLKKSFANYDIDSIMYFSLLNNHLDKYLNNSNCDFEKMKKRCDKNSFFRQEIDLNDFINIIVLFDFILLVFLNPSLSLITVQINFVGNGLVVEIDGSLFVRVKHNKGKDLKREQVWVFGLYERESARCLFFVVVKRNAVNLLNLIYKYVAPNSIIYSDCWSSYNRIKRLDKNYIHRTVNHDLYFVDPLTGCHTNSIESIWNSAKIHLKKMRVVKRCYLQSHLDEYTWRHNKNLSRLGAFEAIVSSIANMYPCGTNIKEEKLCVDDLMDDLSALEINEEDFDFSQENDAEIEPLQDGNIDELDPILEPIESFPVIDEPTLAPAIPAITEPPEAQNIPDMVHGVIPLSKLDTQSFTAAIDMIIFQMEQGLYFEYRFSSDLNKDQRKVIYDKCISKNIEFVKSGTRYVVVSITITKIRVETEPKSDLANELKTLSQIECPRAENVAKILTEDENPIKGKRGRPPKKK